MAWLWKISLGNSSLADGHIFFLSNSLLVGITHFKCEGVKNLKFEPHPLHIIVFETSN